MSEPIDMMLPCPRCGHLHVDAPEPAKGWDNPPHKSHLDGGIYVASRVRHASVWQEFRAAGVPIMASWIDEAGEGQSEDMGELWGRIFTEVARCDRLVFFAGQDDFPHKGALVEVGAALALGKPVTVCLPGVEVEDRSFRPVGSWMHHPLVRRCDSLAEVFSCTNLPHKTVCVVHSANEHPNADAAERGTPQQPALRPVPLRVRAGGVGQDGQAHNPVPQVSVPSETLRQAGQDLHEVPSGTAGQELLHRPERQPAAPVQDVLHGGCGTVPQGPPETARGADQVEAEARSCAEAIRPHSGGIRNSAQEGRTAVRDLRQTGEPQEAERSVSGSLSQDGSHSRGAVQSVQLDSGLGPRQPGDAGERGSVSPGCDGLSHLCHKCGCIWRPADVPTNGVSFIRTRGKDDNWPVLLTPHSALSAEQPLK